MINASVKAEALSNTLCVCVCLFELIHLLLPAAVCRLLVLHPSKFVLDKLNAAVEEEKEESRYSLMHSGLTERKHESTD